MDEEALNASVRKFLKKLGGSRSPHPSKPKTRRLEAAGWRPVSAGPKPRALVLVLHFCTTYPHFHGNGSAMNREHSPQPSPACGCVFASMPAFSLALALRVAMRLDIFGR